MSVKLRLRRMGKKKQPFYRIVAIDSRTARDGRYIENLGTYDPLKNPAEITVQEDRALYWLGQGAQPSDTVKSFLKRKGILLKWHLMKRGVDDAAIEEGMKKWEVLQLERQKRLEALSEQRKREVKKADKETTEAKADTAEQETNVAEDVKEATVAEESTPEVEKETRETNEVKSEAEEVSAAEQEKPAPEVETKEAKKSKASKKEVAAAPEPEESAPVDEEVQADEDEEEADKAKKNDS